MAEPVDGTEIKLRFPELPSAVGKWQSGTGVAVDGLTSGPLFALPDELARQGISTLPPSITTVDLASQPRIPIVTGNKVENYPLADVVSGNGSFYLGPKQFPPTVDNFGNPLVVGHLYYNTLDLAFYTWSPSGTWTLASAAFPGALKAYYYLPVVDTNVVPLGGPLTPDSRGNILTFALTGDVQDRDPINLYLNGALLCNNVDYILTEGGTAGDYINLVNPARAGSIIVVQVLGKPTIDYASNAASANTGLWILNGVTKTFPLRNIAGDDLIPTSTINCIVGINGRVIDPTRDYTVLGPSITFADAPFVGDEIFVTVGLPLGDAVGLSVPAAISPFSYGAVGNGVADDTAALVEAINQINARKAVLDISRGTFRITGVLPQITNPMIDGHGSGSIYLDFDVAGAPLFDCYVAEKATYDVTSITVTTFDFAGAFSSDTEVTAVACTVPAGQTPPEIGDIVKVTAPVQTVGSDTGDYIGQHLYVAAVVNTSGTTWTIYAPSLLVDDYGSTGRQLQILDRKQPCILRDFAVRANYTRLVAEDWKGIAVRVTGAVSPYTSGLTFEDLHQGLFLCGTWRASTNSTFCRRLRNATASEVPPVVGYGVVDAGSYMSVHSDLSGDDCRHVYTTAALQNTNPRLMWGRAFRPTINSGTAGNCSSSAYDTHSDCYEGHFSNIEVDGSYYGEQGTGSGFQFRGIRCRATNCHVRNGPQGFVFYKQNAGEEAEHVLDGCSYRGNGYGIRVDCGDDLVGVDRQQVARVRDTIIDTTNRDAIRIHDTTLEIDGTVRIIHRGSIAGARALYIDGGGFVNSIGLGRLVYDFSRMTSAPNPRMITYEATGCGAVLNAQIIAGAVNWMAWVSDNETPLGAPAGVWSIEADCDKAPQNPSGGYSQFGPNNRLTPNSLKLRSTVNRSRQGATKGSNFALFNSDHGQVFVCTAAITITVPVPDIIGFDFQCTVISTSGNVILDGSGGTNVTVAAGSRAEVKVGNGRVYASVSTHTDMS